MEHRVDGPTAEDEHGDEGDYPRPPRELLSCAKPDCEEWAFMQPKLGRPYCHRNRIVDLREPSQPRIQKRDRRCAAEAREVDNER
jgi:hypothetical protein